MQTGSMILIKNFLYPAVAESTHTFFYDKIWTFKIIEMHTMFCFTEKCVILFNSTSWKCYLTIKFVKRIHSYHFSSSESCTDYEWKVISLNDFYNWYPVFTRLILSKIGWIKKIISLKIRKTGLSGFMTQVLLMSKFR